LFFQLTAFIYLVAALCLINNNNIVAIAVIFMQVSIVGLLFLTGLYISSVSSGMGGIYGAPRILQCIANDGTIPIIRVLSKGVRSWFCYFLFFCFFCFQLQ